MIVSHAHKFIFIKTHKTAGTAIEAALSGLCGPDDIITPYREASETARSGRPPQNYRIEHPDKPPRPLLRRLLGRPERNYHPSVGFYQHMPAWRAKAYLGEEIWRRYFKFAFERNPYERQVSWYFDKTRSKKRRPAFERFMADKKRAFVDNYALYTIDGAPAVDFVGRYESLEADFASALAQAGIADAPRLSAVNVTPGKEARADYRRYYTPATRAVVEDWYGPEIALFGYRF